MHGSMKFIFTDNQHQQKYEEQFMLPDELKEKEDHKKGYMTEVE